ncbi:MAG TPA: helix-turn-helix domain-containing protein [Candidatus Aphodomorpha intestinavium]|uniref:Helix-turn-helix domain-containing protein n=1 Tax=Candidatus Aphodomorpha intestinavium TaxID=2840672 RepID=A0A9D1N2P6_9FIRM|nr:helix-turn-helix domain-containing protein [Candidatus Aphodomorpha intestinavium]
MAYISVREAAAAWGVSERLVQRYCAQGRIAGARKFGVSWEIPAGTPKPADPRAGLPEAAGLTADASESARRAHPGLLPLMNSAFLPGGCRACIAAMPEGPQREIAQAEYWYFSGRAAEAAEAAGRQLNSPEMDVQLSACLLYAYANLTLGQIALARRALDEIRRRLHAAGSSRELRAAEAFVSTTASVLLHLPMPEGLPPAEEYLPLLPPGLRAFALYVRAHARYLQKSYDRSIGLVDATLAMGAEAYPIPAIYLHLVAVMSHMSLREPEPAERHLMAAWALAQPDDLIEGFGEHHGLLGGMLERVIKPGYPEDFKRIIAITYRFSAGWRRVHKQDTGRDVADNLTTTEFTAAMLAARGWTNQEIAAHMNISPHTVKRHISAALLKLGVTRRQDLGRFMLQ